MISIGANSNKVAYGIKHYILDTADDLQNLSSYNKPVGCTCFVIETSKHYMLNSQSKWIEITPFGAGSSSSGGSDSEGGDNDNDNSTPDDVIYEGGII